VVSKLLSKLCPFCFSSWQTHIPIPLVHKLFLQILASIHPILFIFISMKDLALFIYVMPVFTRSNYNSLSRFFWMALIFKSKMCFLLGFIPFLLLLIFCILLGNVATHWSYPGSFTLCLPPLLRASPLIKLLLSRRPLRAFFLRWFASHCWASGRSLW